MIRPRLDATTQIYSAIGHVSHPPFSSFISNCLLPGFLLRDANQLVKRSCTERIPFEGIPVSLCCAKSTDPASSRIVPVRNMWILRFINFVTKKRNDGFIHSEHGAQL